MILLRFTAAAPRQYCLRHVTIICRYTKRRRHAKRCRLRRRHAACRHAVKTLELLPCRFSCCRYAARFAFFFRMPRRAAFSCLHAVAMRYASPFCRRRHRRFSSSLSSFSFMRAPPRAFARRCCHARNREETLMLQREKKSYRDIRRWLFTRIEERYRGNEPEIHTRQYRLTI